MAAMSATAWTRSFLRVLCNVKSTLAQHVPFRGKSHIAMTDDSSVIVCWHPEKFFPYDKSLPVPQPMRTDSAGPESCLKVQSSKELFSVLRPKKEEMVRQELMALTHTPKHVWVPQKFRFRRKPGPRRDRPYL